MILVLRDYQLQTFNDIQKSLQAGNHAIMVQSPPRSGKTVVMAYIAKKATDKGNRVLFVVHRKEIVDQVVTTFKDMGVNMLLANVGMVQTITRRVNNIPPPDLIFVDEAHHVLAKSYRNILNAFPKAFKLMFTGTPYRMNGKGFDDVASDLIIGKSVQWLIDHKRLAPVDYYAPKAINSKALKVVNGDYSNDSIKEAFKPKIYGDAVGYYQKLASDKQAIAYCFNVNSAKQLAKSFQAEGITAVAIDGNTDKATRDNVINDYRNGKIKVVCNVELFTEGLDLPNVDVVIQLRPTKSLSLFLQFAMRSMNYRDGKTAIIIDHVGNVERFGLPTDDRQWSLHGANDEQQSDSKTTVKPVTICPRCFATFYRRGKYCPECKFDLTSETSEPEKVKDGKLIKITESPNKAAKLAKKMMDSNIMNNVAGKQPADLNSYEELKAYGRLMDYKPGWAYYQAKKKGLIK